MRRNTVAARMSCWAPWTVRTQQPCGFARILGSPFCWLNLVGMAYLPMPRPSQREVRPLGCARQTRLTTRVAASCIPEGVLVGVRRQVELVEDGGIVRRPAMRKQIGHLLNLGLVRQADAAMLSVRRAVAGDEPGGRVAKLGPAVPLGRRP
jgi:hypothetical protein